jgi:glycosyltransferase involved in cell wall biosynthesis
VPQATAGHSPNRCEAPERHDRAEGGFRAGASQQGKDAVTVSVVITVRNDAAGCATVLETLAGQIGDGHEIIVVDGGSADGTLGVVRNVSARNPAIRFIEASGANISRGRNVGIEAARGWILVLTDCGCRPDPQWLARITQPFSEDPATEFVAGTYRIETETLLERVVGLATMRGQLEPFDARMFNPSARSMAFTRDTWRRAGGFPEWLYTAEDTLFDVKMRRMGVHWKFAGEAVVCWRPRGSIQAIAKQFYLYGRGGGHTQLSRRDNLYNLRNLGLTAGAAFAAVLQPWLAILAIGLFTYFYVYAFHAKSARIMNAVRLKRAYVLVTIVQWTVLLSDTAGYLVGTFQRLANPKRYRGQMAQYLSNAGHEHAPECTT